MASALVILMLLQLGQAAPEAAQPTQDPPPVSGPADAGVPDDPPDTDPVALPPRRPVIRPFQMPAVTPGAPIPYDPPIVTPQTPVTVENYRRSYEPPPDAIESYYERGVRGAFNAEQSLMGPLDGQWSLKGVDGQPVFTVILNDPGETAPLDGAWRDLRADRQGTGLLDSADRDRDTLVLMLREDGGQQVIIRLKETGDGRWRGEIHDAGGARRTVVMSRN